MDARRSPVTRVETKKAAPTVFGNQDAIAQRSSPELASTRSNRHTVDPLRVPTDHPSPSAQEFRLLLNGLATSELGRIFCSCRQLQGDFGKPIHLTSLVAGHSLLVPAAVGN